MLRSLGWVSINEYKMFIIEIIIDYQVELDVEVCRFCFINI